MSVSKRETIRDTSLFSELDYIDKIVYSVLSDGLSEVLYLIGIVED